MASSNERHHPLGSCALLRRHQAWLANVRALQVAGVTALLAAACSSESGLDYGCAELTEDLDSCGLIVSAPRQFEEYCQSLYDSLTPVERDVWDDCVWPCMAEAESCADQQRMHDNRICQGICGV